MRITIALLTCLGVMLLVLAAGLSWRAHGVERTSVVATGVVTALNEGPFHAEVKVTGADGRKFNYVENSSHAPLAVGEKLAVRYQPAAPVETAQVASGGVYGLATGVAFTGALIILAACLSPFLVGRFPGVLVFPLRR